MAEIRVRLGISTESCVCVHSSWELTQLSERNSVRGCPKPSPKSSRPDDTSFVFNTLHFSQKSSFPAVGELKRQVEPQLSTEFHHSNYTESTEGPSYSIYPLIISIHSHTITPSNTEIPLTYDDSLADKPRSQHLKINKSPTPSLVKSI